MPKYFTMNSKDYFKNSVEELLEQQLEERRKDPKLIQTLRRMSSVKHPHNIFPGTHIRATPLVEVLGVIIDKQVFALTDKSSFKISGTIQATNVAGCGTILDLYNRGDEDPESICLGGLLSLTWPQLDDDLIFPSHDTKLEVHLKDISQGENIDIANGTIDISLKALDDSEAVRVGFVEGKYGRAAIIYATLYSAVVAKVDVKVLFKKNKHDTTCGQIGCDLYGSIIAQYYKCGSLNNTFDKNVLRKCLSRKLFDKSRHQSEHVVHGGQIGLCNSVVAVPAYSSLVIEFDLVNADTGVNIVQDKLEIEAHNRWSIKKDVEGLDCVVQVIVSWCLSNTLKRNMAGGKQKSSPGEQTRIQQVGPTLFTLMFYFISTFSILTLSSLFCYLQLRPPLLTFQE
ncbi:uncharacterized protein LOC141602107 [Silene latifolia]|uniref:uncharacterized protein LOC141602107 n=1 Tax=Silene latifolia TaxID=37657 RepID=UPI003D786639